MRRYLYKHKILNERKIINNISKSKKSTFNILRSYRTSCQYLNHCPKQCLLSDFIIAEAIMFTMLCSKSNYPFKPKATEKYILSFCLTTSSLDFLLFLSLFSLHFCSF